MESAIADGIATYVFPAERAARKVRAGEARVASFKRLRSTEAEPVEAPDAVIIEANTEGEARAYHERLSSDPTLREVYVAPPRYVLGARRGGGRSTAGVSVARNEWGMQAIAIAAARGQAGFRDASHVVVGVIDSGIDVGHPDLAALGVEYLFDGAPTKLKDATGHGTHVSGIIAAIPHADDGMRGVCRPKLRLYKALDPYSPAVYYRSLRAALESCDVVNLSIGGPLDPLEEELITRYLDQTTVVAAMGNEFEEGNQASYPAAIKGVIAVGAVDEHGARGEFSNTGPHIGLCAPGVQIWSTVPTYRSTLAATKVYDTWDGTSMAAPFVTGVVALLLAKEPELKPSQVAARLKTKPCKGQEGFSDEFGAGLLDADATLR